MFDCEVLGCQEEFHFPSSPSTATAVSGQILSAGCCSSIKHRMAVRSVDPFGPRPGQVKAQPVPRARRKRLQINMVTEMMAPGAQASEELFQQPPSKRPRIENEQISDPSEFECRDGPLKRGKLFESTKRLVQIPDGPMLEVPWNVSRWRHFHEGYKYTLSFDLASGALERVKRKRLIYAHNSRD